MKKAVIFDLDGTLLYTLEDLADSVNFALEKYNLNKCTVGDVRTFVGNGVEKLMRRAVAQTEKTFSEENFQGCLNVFKEHYKNNMQSKTKPYAGVESLLAELKKSGVKTAVVSNKFDVAVKQLCDFYFGELIDIAVGESSVVAKKPVPDGVLFVVDKFGFVAEDCIYVGDSEVDIQTANNAGIECISVDWGYKDREFLLTNGAKRIVSTVSELQKFLLNN